MAMLLGEAGSGRLGGMVVALQWEKMAWSQWEPQQLEQAKYCSPGRADKHLLDSAKSSKSEAGNNMTVRLFLAPNQLLLPVAGEESYTAIQYVNSPVCRL